MAYIPEHPAISRALNTGYPGEYHEPEPCERCGDVAKVFSETRGVLCVSCALEEWDELSDREKLRMLGFRRLENA